MKKFTLFLAIATMLAGSIAASEYDHDCDDASCCPEGYPISEGTSANDNLNTGIGSWCLVGLDGDDVLESGASQYGSYLMGGNGNDTCYGGAGDDVIIAGAGDDVIEGGAGDQYLSGGPGNDEIIGGSGDTKVYGGEGDDYIDLGAGYHIVYGGDGNDYIGTGAGDGQIYCGDGNDEVEQWAGNLYIRLGKGDDFFDGSSGDVEIFGGPGNDDIRGSVGDMVIWPGAGMDYVEASIGNDIIIIGSACDVEEGEIIKGRMGYDIVQSPLTRQELESMGVTFYSIEHFQIISEDTSECLFNAEPQWTASTTVTGQISRFVEHSSGDILAITRNNVFKIQTDGSSTLVYDGTKESSISLNPSGDNFGVYKDDVFTVYNRAGSQIGSASTSHSYHKLVPENESVLSVNYAIYADDAIVVEDMRFYHFSGALINTIPAYGMKITRLTDSNLYYTTSEELVKTSLDGVESWRVSAKTRKMKVAKSVDRLIANSAWEQDHVLHYLNGAVVSDTDMEGSVWNIAIFSNGKYSAATTKSKLYIFDNGEMKSQVTLPSHYAISLDVSNQGEIAVGGATTGHVPHVMVFSQNGGMLWENIAALPDDNGWRPEVKFVRNDDGLMVRTNEGLTYFAIERSN